MFFKIRTKGHKNVSSMHKSTFEITKDLEIGPTADCIIGVAMDNSMNDFSDEFKAKIANKNTKITVILDTENGHDEIVGFGHENLTLTHPTDIVCRTSDYVCPRTLMINADKAARDLDSDLIEDLKNEKDLTEDDVTDVFGNLSEDTRKIKKLANKTHREQPRNKYSILKISKSTKVVEYKTALNYAISQILEATNKNSFDQNISGYMWTLEGKNIDPNEINIFNLNPEKEIEEALYNSEETKLNLYKMNFKKGTKGIAFSNCIYFYNQNRTLPLGMDCDTRIIVNLLDTNLHLDSKRVIKVGKFEDEKDETSKLIVKTINVLEYTIDVENTGKE